MIKIPNIDISKKKNNNNNNKYLLDNSQFKERENCKGEVFISTEHSVTP